MQQEEEVGEEEEREGKEEDCRSVGEDRPPAVPMYKLSCPGYLQQRLFGGRNFMLLVVTQAAATTWMRMPPLLRLQQLPVLLKTPTPPLLMLLPLLLRLLFRFFPGGMVTLTSASTIGNSTHRLTGILGADALVMTCEGGRISNFGDEEGRPALPEGLLRLLLL